MTSCTYNAERDTLQRKTQLSSVPTRMHGRAAHPASQSILPAEFSMTGQNGVEMCVRSRYVFGGSFRLIFEIGGTSVAIDAARIDEIKIVVRDLMSDNPSHGRYNLVFGSTSLGLQMVCRGKDRYLAIMGATTSIFLDTADVDLFIGELDRLAREISEFAQKRSKRLSGRPALTVVENVS